MRHLNLAKPESTTIGFKHVVYPDGQQQVVILDNIGDYPLNEEVTIMSRFNSFLDLEKILCATESLKNWGMKNIHLYIPYILGARSDRKFELGDNSYLRDVIAPILNAQNYLSITSLEVHNPVMAQACIPNLKCLDMNDLIKFVGREYYKEFKKDKSHTVLVSPDLGATKRVQHVQEVIGDVEIVRFDKKRVKGKIVGMTMLDNVPSFKGKDIFIFDDICDGGRTFIECAKIIKQKDPGKIFLVVPHGIFSNGFDELAMYFENIYTTNSVQVINKDIQLARTEQDIKLNFVKQLNVF